MENQTPDLSTNKFQEAEKEIKAENSQIQNNQVQIPPNPSEDSEILIAISLNKEKKTIDYSFNSEQLPLILFNKNIIVGMLESIKLDVLIGDNKNE